MILAAINEYGVLEASEWAKRHDQCASIAGLAECPHREACHIKHGRPVMDSFGYNTMGILIHQFFESVLPLKGFQTEERFQLLSDDDLPIATATMDALDNVNHVVVEIKTTGKSQVKQLPHPEHVRQVLIYQYILLKYKQIVYTPMLWYIFREPIWDSNGTTWFEFKPLENGEELDEIEILLKSIEEFVRALHDGKDPSPEMLPKIPGRYCRYCDIKECENNASGQK